MYYQYNFNKASNIFAGMIQSESPYFQPTPKAPAPYDGVVGKLAGDPDYSCSNSSEFGGCDASWAVLMRGCRNIFVAGAGLYSWFSTYTQECSMYLPRASPLLIRASGVALTRDVLHAVDKHECQKALMLLENNGANVRLQHLITIGAKYSLVADGKGLLATDNLNVDTHPSWSQITILDVDSKHGTGTSYTSPESATVIPFPHTTVPPKSTFTLSQPVATDIAPLPYDGDQNSPQGPGRGRCTQCSFFRLISSTCCGTGGSLGNPVTIPAQVPVPLDIELPAGFVPPQPFVDTNGVTHPANQPRPSEATIPRGTVFPEPFVIPAGQPLHGGEDTTTGDGDVIWVDPKIWGEPNPVVTCTALPCTLLFPPWTSATSTLDYPLVTVTDGTWRTTITRPPITVSEWVFDPVTITGPPRGGPAPTFTSTTSSSTGVFPIVLIPPPPFGTTSTWPPVTYVDKSGSSKTAQPTGTPHPGPPGPPGPPGGKGGGGWGRRWWPRLRSWFQSQSRSR